MNAAALLASKAYGGAGITQTGELSGGPQIADTGLNFAGLLAEQVSNTVAATKQAEAGAAGAITGKAELVDVVTAMSAAEVQLETMMAFRDQAINAYQEIMRMPI